MILVRTDWPDFKTYLASLSKPARKNYKAVTKLYEKVGFMSYYNVFPSPVVKHFMELWSRQLVKGKNPQWAFPFETVEAWAGNGEIEVFCAHIGDEVIGSQFIQKREGFLECHPPMYDKTKHPSLAKWMWFKLIEHAIENKLYPLDLGGMSDEWQYNLRNWKDYKHQYKWAFVPILARLDPDSEPKYYIGRPQCKLKLH